MNSTLVPTTGPLAGMSQRGFDLLALRGYRIPAHDCCHTCTFWNREDARVQNYGVRVAACTWSETNRALPAATDVNLFEASTMRTEEHHFCLAYGARPDPRLEMVRPSKGHLRLV